MEFDDELGTEVTVRQCYVCHMTSTFGSLKTMIHGLHKSDTFKAMGGDCWSCHAVDESTGEFALWDTVKYSELKGITRVENVQSDFHYDQDRLT